MDLRDSQRTWVLWFRMDLIWTQSTVSCRRYSPQSVVFCALNLVSPSTHLKSNYRFAFWLRISHNLCAYLISSLWTWTECSGPPTCSRWPLLYPKWLAHAWSIYQAFWPCLGVIGRCWILSPNPQVCIGFPGILPGAFRAPSFRWLASACDLLLPSIGCCLQSFH